MGTQDDPDTDRSKASTARRRSTRRRIVDALLVLIHEGSVSPRAADIALTANVSVRAIFQHFADFRALYLAAADRAVARILPQLVEIAPQQPLSTRIERFMDQRVTLCEAVAPLSRTATIYDLEGTEVQERMNRGRSYSRAIIERVFAHELAALSDDDRKSTVDTVMLACDWDTWGRLRRREGMDIAAARLLMSNLVRVALQGVEPESGSAVEVDNPRAASL